MCKSVGKTLENINLFGDNQENLAFSVERMLSDKIHVIFSQKRFRRVKDLYYVYSIYMRGISWKLEAVLQMNYMSMG